MRIVAARHLLAFMKGKVQEAFWSLIWTLIDPVSYVSCVSWMYPLNAAETHETFHWESGMPYQDTTSRANVPS
jgi:hypothetical protein